MTGSAEQNKLQADLMRRSHETMVSVSARTAVEAAETLWALRNAEGFGANVGRVLVVLQAVQTPPIIKLLETLGRGVGHLERVGDLDSIAGWVPGILGLLTAGQVALSKPVLDEVKEWKQVKAMGQAVAFKENFRQLRKFIQSTTSDQDQTDNVYLHQAVNSYLASVFGIDWATTMEVKETKSTSRVSSACADLVRSCAACCVKPFNILSNTAPALRNLLGCIPSIRFRRRNVPRRARVMAGVMLMTNIGLTAPSLTTILMWEGSLGLAWTHLFAFGLGGLLVHRLALYLAQTAWVDRFVGRRRAELFAKYAEAIYMGIRQYALVQNLSAFSAASVLPPDLASQEIFDPSQVEGIKTTLVQGLMPCIIPALVLAAKSMETMTGLELESISWETARDPLVQERKINEAALALIQSVPKVRMNPYRLVTRFAVTKGTLANQGRLVHELMRGGAEEKVVTRGRPVPIKDPQWCRPAPTQPTKEEAASLQGTYQATKRHQDAWTCAMLDLSRPIST